MFDIGVHCSTNILARTVLMPLDDIDVKLDIPKDKHIIYIKRLHSVDSEPVLLQDIRTLSQVSSARRGNRTAHSSSFKRSTA